MVEVCVLVVVVVVVVVVEWDKSTKSICLSATICSMDIAKDEVAYPP